MTTSHGPPAAQCCTHYSAAVLLLLGDPIHSRFFEKKLLFEVLGGPPDPKSVANGITSLDRNTPAKLIDRDGISVAFTPENYGSRWMIVKRSRRSGRVCRDV